MAYETTFSSMLADQEDLLSKFLEFDNELQNQQQYDEEYEGPLKSEEDNVEDTPDDYEMLKKFYEENQARQSLDESDDDMDFLNFIFDGDNKYRSFAPTQNHVKSEVFTEGNIPTGSFSESISQRESGGNYKAISPNSSARGKYQFIWSIHKDEIANQTGVKSEQEFLNNPSAQEAYFNYWDRTTLTPSAVANYDKFKQYYPQATFDDVKRATHFAGRGGLQNALITGNFTKGIDANKTSIQKYVFGK